MPFQFGANVESCVLIPSLTRAIENPRPAFATWLQSTVPSYFETSAPWTRGPPTGPLGSGIGAIDDGGGGGGGGLGAGFALGFGLGWGFELGLGVGAGFVEPPVVVPGKGIGRGRGPPVGLVAPE